MKVLFNRICSPTKLGTDHLNKNLSKAFDSEISRCTFQIRTKNSLTLEKVVSSLKGFTVILILTNTTTLQYATSDLLQQIFPSLLPKYSRTPLIRTQETKNQQGVFQEQTNSQTFQKDLNYQVMLVSVPCY